MQDPPPAHHVVVVISDVTEALDEFAEHPIARHKVIDSLQCLGSTQLDAWGVTACRPNPQKV
jgi:hypothetical protein